MGRLYIVLFLVNLILAVAALIDCLSTEEHEIRALPRIVWVLIILLFSPVGPIAWFVAGRPQRTISSQHPSRGGTWRPGAGFPEAERPRTLAPDDDPAFLARLNKERKADEDLLRRWEEDLRRREDELRRKDDDDPKA
ncbi:hypothetical protein GCM10009682_09820 [Luedemannella flava]|uniref:Cardiolipin synthase N-terminal domain-containing protein n=1 Tax=Luedemannella flava TaxID=349316 RepID=A0ABP4XSD9_9ACTN